MKYNFQKISPIIKKDNLLDYAILRAKKRFNNYIPNTKNKEKKILLKEKEFNKTLINYLYDKLNNIILSFPSLNDLPEFYQQLINNTVGFLELKKRLSRIEGSKKVLKKILLEEEKKINQLLKNNYDKLKINNQLLKKLRSGFIGRVSSIINKLEEAFIFLENARKEMKKFPALDSEEFTVAIAGFPNVGKSTLLKRITGANPEIRSYAFTTKGLNVGNIINKYRPIQFIDTPGVLGREKENSIEKLATITRVYLTPLIIFVIDPTLTYPIEKQLLLLKKIIKEKKEIIIYFSKTDILEEKKVLEEIIKKLKKYDISKKNIYFEIKKLKERIILEHLKWLGYKNS